MAEIRERNEELKQMEEELEAQVETSGSHVEKIKQQVLEEIQEGNHDKASQNLKNLIHEFVQEEEELEDLVSFFKKLVDVDESLGRSERQKLSAKVQSFLEPMDGAKKESVRSYKGYELKYGPRNLDPGQIRKGAKNFQDDTGIFVFAGDVVSLFDELDKEYKETRFLAENVREIFEILLMVEQELDEAAELFREEESQGEDLSGLESKLLEIKEEIKEMKQLLRDKVAELRSSEEENLGSEIEDLRKFRDVMAFIHHVASNKNIVSVRQGAESEALGINIKDDSDYSGNILPNYIDKSVSLTDQLMNEAESTLEQLESLKTISE